MQMREKGGRWAFTWRSLELQFLRNAVYNSDLAVTPSFENDLTQEGLQEKGINHVQKTIEYYILIICKNII